MSVTSIEHVLVLSDDIDATRDFYCAVVGLRGRRAAAARVPRLLAVRGRHAPACTSPSARPYAAHAARLGLDVPERDPGVGPGRPHRVQRPATTTSSSSGSSAAASRPSRNDVPGGPRQLFIEDPNGVRVEINVKAPTTKQVDD